MHSSIWFSISAGGEKLCSSGLNGSLAQTSLTSYKGSPSPFSPISQSPISRSAPLINLSKLSPDSRSPSFFAIRHLFLQSCLKIHFSREMEATKMRSRRRSATVGVTPIKDGVLSYAFFHVFFNSIFVTIALYNARF